MIDKDVWVDSDGLAHVMVSEAEHDTLKRIAKLAGEMLEQDDVGIVIPFTNDTGCRYCEQEIQHPYDKEFCTNPDCPAVKLRAELAELEKVKG